MPTQSPWMKLVEEKAYHRLRQLRARRLWDGSAPVALDHLLEHVMELTISWEVVEEAPEQTVFACLRPETREIVLNESHVSLFRRKPGLLEFSKAHEIGHADVFALVQASDQHILLGQSCYRPWRCAATKGDASFIQSRLRALTPEHRTEVMREVVRRERERRALGEDSDFERRTVDHYAATLLMPSDLVGREMRRTGSYQLVGTLRSRGASQGVD